MSHEQKHPIPLVDATRLAGEAYGTQINMDGTRVAGAGYQSILATQLSDSPTAGLTERYRIGDRIGGRYEVLAIHRGSMGVVYGTFDHMERLPRALKTLQERFTWKAKLRDLFSEEAVTWVQLGKHPFIVRAYLVEKYDGQPHVITEYVRGEQGMGGDLRAWLGHPRLTLKLAIEMALQIAQGMQHAVKTIPGFVHRDLKPANILVDARARAMVTDFGLVCSTEVEAGTPAYMAPELWNGTQPDQRTDIYAFGCVLYEMLTGHRMFSAKSVEQWRYAHLTQTPNAPNTIGPRVTEGMSALVMKCLAKTPSKRPQDWDEMVNELAAQFHSLTGQPAAFDFSAYELTAGELISASYSLWQLAKYEEMISACDRALEIDVSSAEAWNNKSIALAALGRHKERIECYDYLLKAKPDASVDLWTLKGDALRRSQFPGCREDAIRCFDKALEIDPKRIDALAGKGGELTLCGNPEEALICFDRGLEIAPHDLDLLQGKVLAFHRLGRFDERAATQRRMWEIRVENFERMRDSTPAPTSADGWIELAEMAISANGRDMVFELSCLDHALGFDPNHMAALKRKAAILGRLGRADDCLACHDRILEMDCDDANAWSDKAHSLATLKRYEEAISCFDHALKINTYSLGVSGLECKGHALFALKRYEEAIACLDEALDACGGVWMIRRVDFEYDAWFMKGTAFFNLRFYDAAIACFDQSLMIIDPDGENANIQKDAALRMRNQVKAAASRQLE